MSSFLKRIICFTFTCFIISNSFSQDKILTKTGDTLSVFVKSIDKQKVIYASTNGQQAIQKEIAFSSLHKIVWRTGKEYVIDAEFEKKAVSEKQKRPESIGHKDNTEKVAQFKENIKKDSEFLINQNPISDSKPELHSPSAPSINQKSRVFYYVYKINGKRANELEMLRTIEKYDYECYNLVSSGRDIRKEFYKKQVIGATAGLISIPLSYISQEIALGFGAAAYVFTAINSHKSWKGSLLIKDGISLYENRRKTNSFKQWKEIPFSPN